jgi:hypothetical protein
VNTPEIAVACVSGATVLSTWTAALALRYAVQKGCRVEVAFRVIPAVPKPPQPVKPQSAANAARNGPTPISRTAP